MSFSKKIRQQVYNKTGGKCAYCGCDLPDRWHVDHIVPIMRGSCDESLELQRKKRGTNDIDNLLPSCPSCNIIKSSQSLETFRWELENMYDSVAYNGPFNVAERYGIVERHKKKVQFYFEKEDINE